MYLKHYFTRMISDSFSVLLFLPTLSFSPLQQQKHDNRLPIYLPDIYIWACNRTCPQLFLFSILVSFTYTVKHLIAYFNVSLKYLFSHKVFYLMTFTIQSYKVERNKDR